MAIRKILLSLQPAATAAATFWAAVMVARLWRAHLTVLHTAADRDRETARAPPVRKTDSRARRAEGYLLARPGLA
jgi:hypothetical protein